MKSFIYKKASSFIDIFKAFLDEYFALRIGENSAQLSYYFLFSLFPFLMSASSIAFFNYDASSAMTDLLPEVLDDLFSQFLHHVKDGENATFFSTGLFLFLYAMARYINSIKRNLRFIFSTETEHGFLIEWILSLFYSVFIFAGFALTFILQSVGGEILKALSEHLFFIPAVLVLFWPILRFGMIGIYVFALLMLLYKTVPMNKQNFVAVTKGACFASVSWILISVAFSFYIDNISNHSGIYGSISAFIVLMLWLYIVNNIILSGAVITKILSR